MLPKTCLLAILILFGNSLLAQKEDYNWCIGNFNLNFNNKPVSISALPCHLAQYQACISDKEGKLLMYLDHQYLYIANPFCAIKLPNFHSFDSSTTPYILPIDNVPGSYYILFYNQKALGSLNYSINIYTINTKELAPKLTLVNSFEKQQKNSWLCATVARHHNNRSYWLIIADGNQFDTYLLDKNEIIAHIISTINFPHRGSLNDILRISSDMKYIYWASGWAYFNNRSGYVSPGYSFSNIHTNVHFSFIMSDQGRYLYTTRLLYDNNNYNEIQQLDMAYIDDSSSFHNSMKVVGRTNTISDMQIEPGGKIFCSIHNYLEKINSYPVIDNADEPLPICQILPNYISFESYQSELTFPKFVPHYKSSLTIRTLCNQAVKLKLMGPEVKEVNIDFGDGNSDKFQNISDTTLTYTYRQSGQYTIKTLITSMNDSIRSLNRTILVTPGATDLQIHHH